MPLLPSPRATYGWWPPNDMLFAFIFFLVGTISKSPSLLTNIVFPRIKYDDAIVKFLKLFINTHLAFQNRAHLPREIVGHGLLEILLGRGSVYLFVLIERPVIALK